MDQTVPPKETWRDALPSAFGAILSSPSFLVTTLGPILILLVSKLYLFGVWAGGASSSYANLVVSPEVCALLDHRTQLYTLFIAYGLLVVQFLLHTTPRRLKNGRESTLRTWSGLILGLLSLVLFWFVFQGWLMTDAILALYRGGGCVNGNLLALSPPPLESPVTWLRVTILAAVVTITIMQNRNLARNVENKG